MPIIDKGLLIRSSRILSNLVELLMPLTLIEATEIVFVESSRLGDDCNVANLDSVGVVVELLGLFLLVLLLLFLLLFPFILESVSVLLLVSVSISEIKCCCC